MTKIVFIGAGSRVFTRNLTRDILTFPALADANLVLVDTDPEKLEFARRAVESTIRRGNYPAKLETTTDRTAALVGADIVIITINSHGVDVFRHDLEILNVLRLLAAGGQRVGHALGHPHRHVVARHRSRSTW